MHRFRRTLPTLLTLSVALVAAPAGADLQRLYDQLAEEPTDRLIERAFSARSKRAWEDLEAAPAVVALVGRLEVGDLDLDVRRKAAWLLAVEANRVSPFYPSFDEASSRSRSTLEALRSSAPQIAGQLSLESPVTLADHHLLMALASSDVVPERALRPLAELALSTHLSEVRINAVQALAGTRPLHPDILRVIKACILKQEVKDVSPYLRALLTAYGSRTRRFGVLRQEWELDVSTVHQLSLEWGAFGQQESAQVLRGVLADPERSPELRAEASRALAQLLSRPDGQVLEPDLTQEIASLLVDVIERGTTREAVLASTLLSRSAPMAQLVEDRLNLLVQEENAFAEHVFFPSELLDARSRNAVRSAFTESVPVPQSLDFEDWLEDRDPSIAMRIQRAHLAEMAAQEAFDRRQAVGASEFVREQQERMSAERAWSARQYEAELEVRKLYPPNN